MSEPIIHMVVDRKGVVVTGRCGIQWDYRKPEALGHGITVWDHEVTCPTCRGERGWEMAACEECDENFSREYHMCIDGWTYGPCEHEKCGGVCVREEKCDCRCHRAEEGS